MTEVLVRTVQGSPVAVGSTAGRTVTIDRPAEAGGEGLGFNGGQLLLLALGACYTNDIYREAAAMGIAVRAVQVTVAADWAGEPVRAQNVVYSARVEADATRERIEELMRQTDAVAEIHNSLRLGAEVRIGSFEAVSTG